MSRGELTEAEVHDRLVPALQQLGGKGTLGDIVAKSGLPSRATANTLSRKVVDWDGRLAVDERGELLYSFPRGLHPHVDWGEAFRQVAKTAYAWFQVAYKIGLTVVLLAYFVIFLVLMIALLVAALAKGDGDAPEIDCGDCFRLGDLTDAIAWGVITAPPADYDHFQRGRGLKADVEKSPPFYMRVFQFVFGPQEAVEDPAAQDKAYLAYIRDHKGVIATADLLWLAGGDHAAAERLGMRLLADYDGEPEVGENGTLLYRFPKLLISANARDEARERPWRYWWERPEFAATLTGNSTGANALIIAFNVFNLFWSGLLALNPDIVTELFGQGTSPLVYFMLGWFPFLYSLSFFLIPVIRAIWLNAENAGRLFRNQQRRVLKALAHTVRQGQATLDLGLASTVSLLPGAVEASRPLAIADTDVGPRKVTQSDAEEAVIRYRGDAKLHDSGRITYEFERMLHDYEDASLARQGVKAKDTRLGEIVFDGSDTAADDAEGTRAERSDDLRRRRVEEA